MVPRENQLDNESSMLHIILKIANNFPVKPWGLLAF